MKFIGARPVKLIGACPVKLIGACPVKFIGNCLRRGLLAAVSATSSKYGVLTQGKLL